MIEQLESILTDSDSNLEIAILTLKSKINEIIKQINKLSNKTESCPDCNNFHNLTSLESSERKPKCVCKCHEGS